MSRAGYCSCLLASMMLSSAVSAQQLDRTVLPIQEPDYPPITELDARNAKAPPRFEVKAPEGAPNVLLILIDDMGFGMPSAFGGPIHMPTVDRLAGEGLRYNRFHTTALCSPTRTALLSGRNHHMNNMGAITEAATAFPGNTGQRPNDVAPLAEMLRLNGYSTGFFGKNHETAAWEVSPSGPTDRWPTRSGFDKFYGFIGGETNQWAPMLYDGLTAIEVPEDPSYHFMTDMTDQAIKATLRYEFTYDGGGMGKGGMAVLYVNDKKVAEGRLETTQPIAFSADETADVGVDDATPVVEAMGAGRHSRFTGKIDRVTVEVK